MLCPPLLDDTFRLNSQPLLFRGCLDEVEAPNPGRAVSGRLRRRFVGDDGDVGVGVALFQAQRRRDADDAASDDADPHSWLKFREPSFID